MSLFSKSNVRKLIKGQGFRVSPSAYDGINRAFESAIKQMLGNVEADGMKTLMPQHTILNQTTPKNNTCGRCANIPKRYLLLARTTYQEVCDRALVMAKKIKAGKMPGVGL